MEIVDDPDFTHTYPDRHPTIGFTNVEVGPDDYIGEIGGGEELQRSWFSEERLGIAARGVGSMWRLLEETVGWATSREQGGERIYDYQGVSFPLADSAADAAAGRLLGPPGRGDDRRRRRPQARPSQGLDGEAIRQRSGLEVRRPLRAGLRRRGYVRSNVAERFLRELRVDRIWEGTSEIQRLIIARGLKRRGVERILH